MKNTIAMIIVVVSTIICFAGCASKNDEAVKVPCLPIAEKETKTTRSKATEAKSEMWTVGIDEIKRIGDDLVSSIIIRPLASSEAPDFVFTSGTEIISAFVVTGSNGIDLKTYRGSFFKKGEYPVRITKFFEEYSPGNINDTTVKVRMVILSAKTGEILWDKNKENPQELSIK